MLIVIWLLQVTVYVYGFMYFFPVVNCTVLEAPANGTLTGDGVTVMSEVTYSCDAGFILSGDTNRTCQADGSWTGNAPVCNSKQGFKSIPYSAVSILF